MFQINLKKLREEKNISQAKLAAALGVRQSTVAMWENGKNKPEHNTLIKIADYFNVSTDQLLNRKEPAEENNPKKGVKIPVLGFVAAGIPIEAVEDIIDYEEIPETLARTGEFFGLVVKGTSMEPEIHKGDVVIVKKQSDIDSGDIAIVLVNGDEGTCKKVMKYNEGLSLVSFNPAFPPKFYNWQEVDTIPISICGKVVELRRKF